MVGKFLLQTRSVVPLLCLQSARQLAGLSWPLPLLPGSAPRQFSRQPAPSISWLPAATTAAVAPPVRAAEAAAAAASTMAESSGAAAEPSALLDWRSLGTPAAELRLEHTLPTGQSFRWRCTSSSPLEFTGVIGARAVRMRQLDGDVEYAVLARGAGVDPADDHAALADYFNLATSLAGLAKCWAAADPLFASLHPHLPGARMLQQDPLECLLSFICSQNNHISRIHGMVERFCRAYGTPLLPAGQLPATSVNSGSSGAKADGEAIAEEAVAAAAAAADMALYAFPTLEQLAAAATEEALRADGFGYRAKYIVGTVAALVSKPGGGGDWLQGLRRAPYAEAAAALCELPGIGPKVAACVCLFSLDKHEAIPVDTHVFQIACRHYTPHLRGRSLTPKLHAEIAGAFQARFGSHAGWAHNTLFIAELPSIRDKLPGKAGGKAARAEAAATAKAVAQAAAAEGAAATAKQEREGVELGTPQEEGEAGSRKRRRRVVRQAAAELP